MAVKKIGVKRKKPSHMKYNSENHLRQNKIRRITRFNGPVFLDSWMRVYGKA